MGMLRVTRLLLVESISDRLMLTPKGDPKQYEELESQLEDTDGMLSEFHHT